MRKVIKKAAAKLTWKNAKWFMVKNGQSWLIQGGLYGVLALVGVGTVSALVSAKVAAYVVFGVQCLNAARNEN